MNRADLFNVRVSIEGRDLGVWDQKSGGEVDSDETTYRPGGSEDQISLGGPVTAGNLTISKLFDESAANGVYHWLVHRAGRSTGTAVQQPLDAERRAFGR